MTTLSLYSTTLEEMLPLHLLEQEHHPAVHRGQALPALLHHSTPSWKEADLNTAMSQLLLQTHTLAGFKLVEFDEKIEMVEGIDGLRLSPYMCLVRGVLLTNTRR